jgi:hypothetical protein
LVAALIGAAGALACGVALAVAGGSWAHVGPVAVGGVLVQVVAGLVGCGLGLLLRSTWLAFAASVVLPLGLWLLLGGVDDLRPAQAWLTPYAAARNQLSGTMGVREWLQWLVIVLIWPIGLTVVGARVRPCSVSSSTSPARRRRSASSPASVSTRFSTTRRSRH